MKNNPHLDQEQVQEQAQYTTVEKLEILKGYMHTEAMEHRALRGAHVESIGFPCNGSVTYEIILRTEVGDAEYGTSFDPLMSEHVEMQKYQIEQRVRGLAQNIEEDLRL